MLLENVKTPSSFITLQKGEKKKKNSKIHKNAQKHLVMEEVGKDTRFRRYVEDNREQMLVFVLFCLSFLPSPIRHKLSHANATGLKDTTATRVSIAI